MEQEEKKESVLKMFLEIPGFWKAQHNDWRVTVIRTSLERFGYQMIYPYLTIFIVGLGAAKTQIGIITCIGLALSGIISIPLGNFIDRDGPRRVYIAGIVLLMVSYLMYSFAPVWQWAAAAMVVYYLGSGSSIHSCSSICGTCLRNCDRAKGMMLCESVAAGLLGMIGPMISAWILVHLLHVEGSPTSDQIRPLFYCTVVITFISLIVVVLKLSKNKGLAKNGSKNFIKDCKEILGTYDNTKKWLIIAAVNAVPQGMILPYVHVFAEEMKGAGASTLALMTSICAVTSCVLGYPMGALADKYGRKKILYFTISLFALSNLLLIIAPSPLVLVISGGLLGFYYISSPMTAAVARELVPNHVMGRWTGITNTISKIFSAIMAVVSGVIYDTVGGQWIFIFCIVLDLCVRIPLLASIPETLTRSVDD